jgi:hypothetical protein
MRFVPEAIVPNGAEEELNCTMGFEVLVDGKHTKICGGEGFALHPTTTKKEAPSEQPDLKRSRRVTCRNSLVWPSAHFTLVLMKTALIK